jgi:hypothetical protein
VRGSASPTPLPRIRRTGARWTAVAGSLVADGELRGNVGRLDVEGRVDVEDLLYEGVTAGRGGTDFSVAGIGTEVPDVALDGAFDNVTAGGMQFDHVTVAGEYRGSRYGEGQAVLAARQDEDTDYMARVTFQLSLDSNELRVADATLRFDTVTWRTVRPGTVRWSGDDIDVDAIEFVSDGGGRIYAHGRLPMNGTGDLHLALENVEIAQVTTLLQQETDVAGRLDLDARVQGTRRDPLLAGTATLTDATVAGDDAPDARVEFEYAERELAASAEFVEDDRLLMAADALLPIHLGLAGDVPVRLLDRAISVDIRADSPARRGVPGSSRTTSMACAAL